MKKVLIPTKLNSIARTTLEKHGNYVVVQDEKTNILSLAKQHPDTYALIVRSEKITSKIIDAFPSLKVIVRAGSGYNTIDINYARKKRSIDVMNTPGANSNAVAEEVIGLMLNDARHVIEADRSTREGKWEKSKFMGQEISKKTIGIVGLGNVGQLVAKRLSGFDVKLLGYDPMISQDRADSMHVEIVDLLEIFKRADYITLHVPENEETRGMINEELLLKMKEGATLINCARANLIVEDDLRKVKAKKNIRFPNDVYRQDADGEKSVHDIADIMLPHLGASTYEANFNAARRAAEELINLDDKGITSFIVNREVPEGLDEAYVRLAYTLTKLCRHLLGPTSNLKSLETSFYGSLQDFSNWLMIPIIRALGRKIDHPMDQKSALQYLKEMGVAVINRPTDTSKGYKNSITIDLISSLDSGNLRRVSVRGTVVEGVVMISRITDFDRLYFQPKGPTAFFIYNDRPGILGKIGSALAKANINIEDVRNPHHRKLNQSLGIMQVNKPVSKDLIAKICKDIKAISSFYYDFSQ